MKIQLAHKFEEIISLDNLLLAWQEFIKGKKTKPDVQAFSLNLFDNILALQYSLGNKNYRHGGYKSFYINDPKRRHIHKASVCDRLLHHAVYRLLYPFFERTFITDSYSCRLNKGTHKALNRFREFAFAESKNYTRTCWALKIDIRKFFASIDHEIFLRILSEYVKDNEVIWLLEQIIRSYSSMPVKGVGLPLGNLTSQLFANIYLNPFDQWVNHNLKVKHYLRYADDMVFLSTDKECSYKILSKIDLFLQSNLRLNLHPNKIIIKTVASGVDFLGWLHFSDHRILRKSTKRRMCSRIKKDPNQQMWQSYLGLLCHGNTYKIQKKLLNEYWLYKN
jgi:retron-type reverse transcriptase